MEMLQEIYTGTLDYKGIEFNFIFSGNELRPVPPKDKIQDVYRDFLTRPLGNGAYTMNIPVMEESHFPSCNLKHLFDAFCVVMYRESGADIATPLS